MCAARILHIGGHSFQGCTLEIQVTLWFYSRQLVDVCSSIRSYKQNKMFVSQPIVVKIYIKNIALLYFSIQRLTYKYKRRTKHLIPLNTTGFFKNDLMYSYLLKYALLIEMPDRRRIGTWCFIIRFPQKQSTTAEAGLGLSVSITLRGIRTLAVRDPSNKNVILHFLLLKYYN